MVGRGDLGEVERVSDGGRLGLHVEHLDPRTCDWLKSTHPASLLPVGQVAPGDSTWKGELLRYWVLLSTMLVFLLISTFVAFWDVASRSGLGLNLVSGCQCA